MVVLYSAFYPPNIKRVFIGLDLKKAKIQPLTCIQQVSCLSHNICKIFLYPVSCFKISTWRNQDMFCSFNYYLFLLAAIREIQSDLVLPTDMTPQNCSIL